MKKILFLLFLLSCTSQIIKRDYQGISEKREEFSGIKKKLAILTLFNEALQGGKDLAVVATEELRRELMDSGVFTSTPNAVRLFGSSKEIYSDAGNKLFQITRKAKLSGVNLIIYGRIVSARIREKSDEIGLIRKIKTHMDAEVEVRIHDVNSGREIYNDSIKSTTEDNVHRFFSIDRKDKLNYRRELLRYGIKVAIRKSIPKIIKISSALSWTGKIARITGSKIYINAGRQSGINIGDILQVMTEGDDIFDPDTGALIGKAKGQVKGTLEIIEYFSANGSIAVLHSGGAVVEGDIVQLY